MSWTPPGAPAENAIANRGEASAESGEEEEEEEDEEEQETRPATTTAANERGTIMRGIVSSSESVFGAKYTAFPQMVPSVAEPRISRVSGEPVTSSLAPTWALTASLPLRQERERGRWPVCFEELWQRIDDRYGASEAASQMVDVLLLVRKLGVERVELAVRGTLAAGAHDGRRSRCSPAATSGRH